jgi:hypothetical protein
MILCEDIARQQDQARFARKVTFSAQRGLNATLDFKPLITKIFMIREEAG